jgi:hypothetical protein
MVFSHGWIVDTVLRLAAAGTAAPFSENYGAAVPAAAKRDSMTFRIPKNIILKPEARPVKRRRKRRIN